MNLIEVHNESNFRRYLPAIGILVWLISVITYEIIMKGNYLDFDVKRNITGVVASKYENKGRAYLQLQGQDRKVQIGRCFNYAYSKFRFCDFVEVGDLVQKNSCSDTLYVTRGKEEFNFIHEARWYNNNDKSKAYNLEYKSKRLVKLLNEGCPVDSVALDFAIRHLNNIEN